MVSFPVHVRPKPYSGNNQKCINQLRSDVELARRIEKYLNTEMEGNESQLFTYGEIASDLGIPLETVRRLLFPLDGGYHGITVINPSLKKPTEPHVDI